MNPHPIIISNALTALINIKKDIGILQTWNYVEG